MTWPLIVRMQTTSLHSDTMKALLRLTFENDGCIRRTHGLIGTLCTGSCLTSGGAVEAERAGEECRSCANPAHMHEVAVRGHKRSKSSISSSESTASTQTEDVHLSIDGSLVDSSRPQSYLPRCGHNQLNLFPEPYESYKSGHFTKLEWFCSLSCHSAHPKHAVVEQVLC